MSKIMSVFEKLNLVEKVDDGSGEKITAESDAASKSDSLESNSAGAQEVLQENNSETFHKVDKIKIATDRSLSNEEIYTKSGMKEGGTNTIFMLEKFVNALPEKLPLDVKKETVMSILEASDTNLNVLVTDGEKRLDILQNYKADYTGKVNEAVDKYKKEIEKLNRLIKEYEEQICIKESLLVEQNNGIKKETERIETVMNFFKNN